MKALSEIRRLENKARKYRTRLRVDLFYFRQLANGKVFEPAVYAALASNIVEDLKPKTPRRAK